MGPDVEGYWIQAERNLQRSRADLANGFYDGCVANSQQTAELALKALAIEVTTAPAPHTHDLAVLEAALGSRGVRVPAPVVAAISGLPERTWTHARYPDAATNYVPARDISEQEARQALANAETIFTWVQQQLAPPTTPSTGPS